MFNENLDDSPHYDNKFNFPDEGEVNNNHDNKARNSKQLKHKFNNLIENATVSDLKKLHKILDLVEVNDFRAFANRLDQHIWYRKDKFKKLYKELNEDDWYFITLNKLRVTI